MPKFSVRWVGLLVAVVSLWVLHPHAQKGPTIDDVLQAASNYLVKYSDDLKAVHAEEDYLQMDTSGGQLHVTRRMTSDVLMLGFGRGVVGSFRDVAMADGHVANDQRDRLVKIFTDTPDGAMARAQQVVESGVHEYLSPNLHAFDTPLIALDFLKPENRDKLTFKLDGVKTQNGVQVATIKYTEKPNVHVLQTPLKAPANGRIQIEMPSGIVRSTEIIVTDKAVDLRATVTYALDSTTGLWLPASLDQQLDASQDTGDAGDMGQGTYSAKQSLEAHAKYSKFATAPIDLTKIR